MGDKSPKSKQKGKAQKESKANASTKKKEDLAAGKKLSNTILAPKNKKK